MKIKIISDGRTHGTRVVDIEGGDTLENVVSVRWSAEIGESLGRADIGILGVPAEMVAEDPTMDENCLIGKTGDEIENDKLRGILKKVQGAVIAYGDGRISGDGLAKRIRFVLKYVMPAGGMGPHA